MAAVKRIDKELRALQKAETEQYSVQPSDEDPFEWTGIINGPDDTPYEGGVFFLDITFPKDYPFKPPQVKFQTKIYHCNVNEEGSICLPLLKEEWSPALSIAKVLTALVNLLEKPNLDTPLRTDVAQLFNEDKAKHDEVAKDNTEKFAM